MASIHTTNSLVSHPFDGTNSPAIGALIKIRFGGQLSSPGSLGTASSYSLSCRPSSNSPPHSALVVRTAIAQELSGRMLTIECFPITSYHRSVDSVAAASTCSGHIPVPNTTELQTPGAFRKPLKAGGYINDRPCWIQVQRHVVTLEVGQKVKILPFVIGYY